MDNVQQTKNKERIEWTASDDKKLEAMRGGGLTCTQMATRLGKPLSLISARLRIIVDREKRRAVQEENRRKAKGRYLIKKTDFAEQTVTTVREVVFAEHGSSRDAWNYAVDYVHKYNMMAKRDRLDLFYWIKYM